MKLDEMSKKERNEFISIRAARLRVAEDDHSKDKDVAVLIEKRIKMQADIDALIKKRRELQVVLTKSINDVVKKLEDFIPEKFRIME